MIRRRLFRTFGRFYRLQRWLDARVSPGGRLLLGAAIASGVFGIDVRKSLAYQMFALAGALVTVAAIGVVLKRGRFRMRRSLPRFATVGESFRYVVELTNLSERVQAGLSLREAPSVELPSFEAFATSREPGHDQRNWFDRYVGYPRWAWMVRLAEGVSAAETPVPPLASGATVSVELTLTAHRRGQVSLRGATVLCPEPLGLLRRAVQVPAPGAVLVLPKWYPVPSLELDTGPRHRAARRADRRSFGGGDEMKGLREFRPGDPLRYVDWRASARLGEPMVKEFHDERKGGLTVFLDTDGETHGDTFEVAVSLAASLAALRLGGEPAELLFVRPCGRNQDRAVGELVRARGREHALTLLSSVQAGPLEATRQAGALPLRLRADLVIAVLLGWDAPRQTLVQALRERTAGEVAPLVALEAGQAPPPAVAWAQAGSLERDLARFARQRRARGRRAA